MNNDYLSDDECLNEEYLNNNDNYNYFNIEYDKDLVGYLSDEINEDELDEDELKEYKEYLANKQKEKELIMTKTQSDSIVYFEEYIKEKKIQKNKPNKSMDFHEFNNYIEQIVQDNKPKKFISKRLLNKKETNTKDLNLDSGKEKQDSSKENLLKYKRQFRPKLPPYFSVYPKN
jgi:hypothetical protein